MSLHHLRKCSARPITTADILTNDALNNEIPEDQETRRHFGFFRCRDWKEESHLLRLYIGLVRCQGVHANQLHEWRQEGILLGKILETFSALPEKNRGIYFPWFLRNQHILDHTEAPLHMDNLDDHFQGVLQAARAYLDPEDRGKDFSQFMPPAKLHCFKFYAMLLDGSYYPNPNTPEPDLWYDFGFVACSDVHAARSLGSVYCRLFGGNRRERDYHQSLGVPFRDITNLPTASFDEFWRAWKSGNLAELFDQYGLGDRIDRIDEVLGSPRRLREFLALPGHQQHPSVWRLKHLLALEDNTQISRFPLIEAAVQEYGFTPHLDARTKVTLLRFYRELLISSDPLEVHRARNRRELFEYVKRNFQGNVDHIVWDALRKLRRS
ncbi:hypothetical protein H0H93_011858 [Arthromyces matolae]|nr:hypothetical protein H0H93_011858 [Arthromyces matolae]